MSPRAALSGNLSDLPLPELLPFLASGGQPGVIELSGAAGGLIVLADDGIILALADDGPTLQQVVIGSGITSADGWDAAQGESLKGRPLADCLIDHGADEDRLATVLHEQTLGALFEFLVATSAAFVYLPGATHPLGSRFRFDPAELLAAAQDRVHAWKEIAASIPSVSVVMRLRRELPGADVTIGAEDWRVLALVDGHTSVAELIRDLGMSAFSVCAVLHRFLGSGLVERCDGGQPDVAAT